MRCRILLYVSLLLVAQTLRAQTCNQHQFFANSQLDSTQQNYWQYLLADAASQPLALCRIVVDATEANSFFEYQVATSQLRVGGNEGLVRGLSLVAQQHLSGMTASDLSGQAAYAWRGLMVDVARHYRGESWLLNLLDEMAALGLNRLHLHLTDDQGWRFPVDGWPRLISVGSLSSVGGGTGGYYSHDFLRRLTAKAASLGILVVPEIDLPGHIQSAIASYPQLACEGAPTQPDYAMVVAYSKLCLSNKWPLVTHFARDVLQQVMAVFSSPWIHVGGDEVDDDRYGEFMLWLAQLLAENNRQMIAWQEVLQVEGLPDAVMTQWWSGASWPQIAADKQIPTILSPCEFAYFDHGYYSGEANMLSWCNPDGLPNDKVAQFEPLQYTSAVGIEAALWGEKIQSDTDADYRLWPRLIVFADIAWQGQANAHWQQQMQAAEYWRQVRRRVAP